MPRLAATQVFRPEIRHINWLRTFGTCMQDVERDTYHRQEEPWHHGESTFSLRRVTAPDRPNSLVKESRSRQEKIIIFCLPHLEIPRSPSAEQRINYYSNDGTHIPTYAHTIRQILHEVFPTAREPLDTIHGEFLSW